LIYGLGGQMDPILTGVAMGSLLLPIFNLGFGLSPTTIGIVLMGFRFWDALIDPLMGNISDNTRTRWGRRRPYIVCGAFSVAILLPFLWRVDPSLGEFGKALHLLIFGLLIYTAYTVWAMPYQSLGMELTRNYDERTRLSAWSSAIGIPIGLIGAWNFAFISGPWFAGADGKPDLVNGVQTASLIHAALILCIGMLPGLFIKEHNYKLETSRQAKEPFWSSMKTTLRTGPLWTLAGVVFFNLLGLASIGALGQYINIYFVNKGAIGDASMIEGWKATAMTLTSLASIPFWTWFCERTDKKFALRLVLIGTFVGHGLNYFCLRPDMPYLQIIPAVFYSAISSSIWLITPSMRMDVSDYDELKTGRRREGSLSSVFSWAVKMAGTLSVGLGGLVLDLTGFVSANTEQTPETLQRMFWTYLLLPAAFWSVSLFCLSRFRLDRSAMKAIRRRLEVRHQYKNATALAATASASSAP
jgi:GPH family glycoside/pentoside/hexuronide:cation symporter